MSFLNFAVYLLCKKHEKYRAFQKSRTEAQYFESFGHPNPSLRLSDDFTKNYDWLKKNIFSVKSPVIKCTSILLNIIYREKGDTFKISFSPLISFAGRCTNTLMVSSSVSMLIYQTKLSCYIFSVKSISRNYPQNIFKVFYKLYYVMFNLGGQRENTIIKILENLSNKSHI